MNPSVITEKKQSHLFKKGQCGNPNGRPKGSISPNTRLVREILTKDIKLVSEKLVEMALEGNIHAIKLIIERILPPVKDLPISVEFPEINNMKDFKESQNIVLLEMKEGNIAPSEGALLMSLLEPLRKTIELEEFEKRINVLEEVQLKYEAS